MIMYWKGCCGSIQHSETGCPSGLNQMTFCVKIYFLTWVEKNDQPVQVTTHSPPAKPLLRDGCWKTCPSPSVIRTNKLHTGHCSEWVMGAPISNLRSYKCTSTCLSKVTPYLNLLAPQKKAVRNNLSSWGRGTLCLSWLEHTGAGKPLLTLSICTNSLQAILLSSFQKWFKSGSTVASQQGSSPACNMH